MFNKVYSNNYDIDKQLYHLGIQMSVVFPASKIFHQNDLPQIAKVCRMIQAGQGKQALKYGKQFQMLTRAKIRGLVEHPDFFRKALPLIRKKAVIEGMPRIDKYNRKIAKYQRRIHKHQRHHTPRQKALAQKNEEKLNKVEKLKQIAQNAEKI